MNTNYSWSVFVGGSEVNDFMLSKIEAQDLADDFLEDNYDDIFIVNIKTNEEIKYERNKK